jgi:hypothetical protein
MTGINPAAAVGESIGSWEEELEMEGGEYS